ncbi:TPA: glycosyltransferase [Vibrio parahaemolyticus]|uniref:Glycosyltransferase 2-like domain-containing protein n=8 Tax=Vibrio parahaemolyticus TaxID=670 RepID=A0A7M1W4F2_VIBPH|nr:glycosyltransferase [Vibrio parahaemolyticus]EGR2182030.1 glycosyltransferase [Vibrio parahaemolyticus]EHJ9988407.1 glycosyltransferase [Vibrio parahaemolyticus]ELA9382933.1 glycosyltransferase [Vibrio parahaemolyticus]MBE4438500.1 glycosyltransferase [Vibrio parahaemolyticus]MBE5131204.1 glycosyltransferase [Vibrio parahaemolyticus]
MLSKKFQLIKSEIDSKNYVLAARLLKELAPASLAPASKALYLALMEKLPPYEIGNVDSRLIEAKYLSDLEDQDIKPGISIVSCCMNRNENLLKALKTWVKLPVDEIIIVDWSSSERVIESIKSIQDDRIKVLRVEGEPKWILTYGFNVGLRFASYTKVFKFDADIEVSLDFLERNNFGHNQFVRGYWKSALDEGLESQVYVNGSFGAYKEHLKEIGYYNELIRTYGWDDSDMYERLSASCGLSTTYLDFRSVLHMEQKEVERTIYQDVITDNYLGVIPTTEFNNQRNKFIGRTTDYWSVHRLQDYSVKKTGQNEWILSRTTKSIDIPSYLDMDANIYAAIHYLWHRKPNLMKKAHNYKDISEFIFSEYKEGINFDITANLLGESDEEHIVCFYNKDEQPYGEFLDDCLELSKTSQVRVYAVAFGDIYSHKRLGDVDNFIEVLVLTEKFIDTVSAQRSENQLQPLQLKRSVKVSYSMLEDTFKDKFIPKLYIDAQHGLGNRIRAIGSAAAIARQTGRELVIIWEPDHHCECRFDDLFDYEGKVINESFVGMASKTMDLYNYMEIEAGACKDELIKIDEGKHLYLRAAYTFNSPYSTWDEENVFIQSLNPTLEIKKLVEKFDLTNSIAAHIRMEAGAGLDHNTYDSVDNWTQEGHDQLHFWREKSHYSHFIKRLDEIIHNDNATKIFLATDLPETYKVFQDYYGERLCFLTRDVFDRSKEQIKYALADAILLSKATKLLGSTWSSFSELAMRMSVTYSDIEMSGRDF